jgi:hypothetical protein
MGGFFFKSNQSYVFCSFAVAKATGGKRGEHNSCAGKYEREREREREQSLTAASLSLSLSLQSRRMEGVTEPSGKVY